MECQSFSIPTVPSGPVTNLNARNINATIVELSWGPVMAREQNGIILSYNIYYQQNDSNSTYNFMTTNITEMVRAIITQHGACTIKQLTILSGTRVCIVLVLSSCSFMPFLLFKHIIEQVFCIINFI